MAQGEFWVERQNWARWPRVLKVNRHTEHGTETRRYLPERHEDAWSEREYAVGKIADLLAENAKLRASNEVIAEDHAALCEENAKLRELLHDFLSEHADYIADGNYFIGDLDLEHAMHHNQAYFRHEAKKLGVEVDS